MIFKSDFVVRFISVDKIYYVKCNFPNPSNQ
nr:MAG TPA: hypothetical protein [Caudoviricetes sp.]